ncbi:unnamed protein product [Phaeothamnion confervicola]
MLTNDLKEASQVYAHIKHPGTRALFSFWEKIRGEKAAPNRDDLDLRQIVTIVPNLVMLERDHLHQTFKWRLAGSEISQLYRQKLTNTDALAGWRSFERDTLKQLFTTVVTSLQPCLVRYHLTTDADQVLGAELLGLPMHARNGSRFHIFGGIFPLRDVSNLGYSAITFMELTSARSIWTEPLPGDKLVASLNTLGTRPGGFRLIRGGRP